MDQFGSYTYQGGSYGDIEFPAEPQDHNAVDQFLGLKSSSEDTYAGGALPAPSSVTVSVLNGSGAYNQATTTSQGLQALGFHIGTIGDSPPVGQEAETVVYYAAKTPADLAAAQLVANSLSGAVIMAMDPTQVKAGSQVTVVTGTDFSVNAPPATTTTAPAGVTSTTHDNCNWQQRQRRELGRVPGTDGHGRVAAALGPSFLHRQRGRRPLTPVGPRPVATRQTKISPPLVSSASPVMADERSEAR